MNSIDNLVLNSPITSLSGETITELQFDFQGLKPRDYREMVKLESRLKGAPSVQDQIQTKKTSPEFRMSAAWIAAVKGTKGICLDDIDSINVLDMLELEEVGLLFFAQLG